MAAHHPEEVSEVFLVRVQISGTATSVARNVRYAKTNARRIADAISGDVSIGVYAPDGTLESTTIIGETDMPPEEISWTE